MMCSYCDGRGQIYMAAPNMNGGGTSCPYCDGRGHVPDTSVKSETPVKPPDDLRLRKLALHCPLVHATLRGGGSVLDCLELVVAEKERLLQELVTAVGRRPPTAIPLTAVARGESPDTHVG